MRNTGFFGLYVELRLRNEEIRHGFVEERAAFLDLLLEIQGFIGKIDKNQELSRGLSRFSGSYRDSPRFLRCSAGFYRIFKEIREKSLLVVHFQGKFEKIKSF